MEFLDLGQHAAFCKERCKGVQQFNREKLGGYAEIMETLGIPHCRVVS